jgi:hypothetical protein
VSCLMVVVLGLWLWMWLWMWMWMWLVDVACVVSSGTHQE